MAGRLVLALALLVDATHAFARTRTPRLDACSRARATRRSAADEPLDVWADAVSAFDGDDDEEAYYGLSPPRPDAPPWLHAAIVAAGGDAELALAPLTDREADVLLERYWMEPSTQLECSLRLDLSLARVAQLERAARRKLETTGEIRELESDDARRALAEGSLMLTLFEKRVGYFYFRDELRVDEETLSRVLAQHGPVLSQRRDTLQRKGEALRENLDLDDAALRRLVSSQPTILGLNADALAAKIAWLAARCGVPRRRLGDACVRCPQLLTASLRKTLEPNFRTYAHLDAALPAALLGTWPGALRATGLRGRLRALDALDAEGSGGALAARAANASLDAPKALALRVAEKAPRVLCLDAATLAARVNGLVASLGARAASDACYRHPELLLTSPDQLARLTDALGDELALSARAAAGLGTLVATKAAKVANSVADAKLRQRLAFLRDELGLGVDRAAAVVSKRPQCLGLSVPGTLRTTCRFLAARLLGAPPLNASAPPEALDDVFDTRTRANLASLVASYPTVLGLSVDANLAPKLDALAAAAADSPGVDDGAAAAAAAVIACPALLGYSLDSRLRPRLEEMRLRGLPFVHITNLAQVPERLFLAKLEGRVEKLEREAGEPLPLTTR